MGIKLDDNTTFTRFDDRYTENGATRSYRTYIPDYSNPELQREEAVTESISLLRIVSKETRQPDDDMPVIVWFNRAVILSNKLRSLGFRDEALQLCILAHEVIQKLAVQNSAFFSLRSCIVIPQFVRSFR